MSPFPHWPGLEPFYQRFGKECSIDERRVLQVLSLADIPLNRKTLEKIIVRLKWESSEGGSLSVLFRESISEWRERWQQEDWIGEDRERFRCSRLLVDMLSRELALAGLVDEVNAAVEKEVARGYWASGVDPNARYLRAAFYQHNDVYLRHWLELEENPWERISSELQPEVTTLCYFPMQKQWLDQLPDWLHYQALVYLIRDQMETLEGVPGLWEQWQQRVEPLASSEAAVTAAVVEFSLYRGDLEQAQTALERLEGERATALRGWLALESGEPQQALELLEQSLVERRKRTRKRKVNHQGLLRILQQMLYLRQGDAASLQEVSKISELYSRESADDYMVWPMDQAVEMMEDVALFLSGKLSAERCSMMFNDVDNGWDQLFRAIALHWIGEPVPEEVQQALREHIEQSDGMGVSCYGRQARAVLQAVASPVMEEFQGSREQQDSLWIHFIRPKQKWERALDAISGMAASGQSDSKEQELRMVWRLGRQGNAIPELKPREQKRGKSGKWTKGRAVALKKLYQEPEEYSYLTAQDRRICQSIQERWENSGWGHHKTIYVLDTEQALPALIGHPLVELEESPGVVVEVAEQKPALEVVEEGVSLRVQLSPFPQQDFEEEFLPLSAHWEGGRRLMVVHFDPPHLQVAQILGEKGVSVPMAAKQRVLDSIAAIAPLLTVHSAIGGEAAGMVQQEADPTTHLHLIPEGDGIRFSFWSAPFGEQGPRFYPGKGGTVVFGEIDGEQRQAHRNLQEERQRALDLLGGIEEQVPNLLDGEEEEQLLDERLLDDPEQALELLFYLKSLPEEDVVLDWPKDARIPRLREIGAGNMKVGVKSGTDWFSLNGELQVDGNQVVALKQLWGLLEQTPGRFLRMEDGAVLALTKELRKKLDAIRSYGGEDGKIHPLALSAMDEALEGMQFRGNKSWREQRQKIEEAQQLQPVLPATLEADLREYQQQGVEWMMRLAHWGAGGCLADDMGLGKTLQALTVVLSRASEGATLVLAPTSVCMNWQEEANRFTPVLRPLILGEGARKERRERIEQLQPYDLVICSYGLLQREVELLQSVEWQTIVIDEAQAIKNAATKRSKAVMGLQGAFRLITTGTPVENHLGELWNLFRFINPGLLGSLERFNERYARPIEMDRSEQAQQRLKNLISPFILRRLKRDVLTELPPRTEITLHVEMEEEESVFMEALRQRSIERIEQIQQESEGPQHLQVLAEITRLRQACCHPRLVDPESTLSSAKLRVFAKTVEELLESGHRALVFSQFVGHLSLIREYLDRKQIHYQYLDGSTPAKKRKQVVDAFQGGEGELFLISLKAGGSGLNLTAADYVIHMDPWWNPAVEDQASDRAHRMGQTRPVTIYRLVVKGSIEEKIVDLHQHKRDLADQLLEGSDQQGRLSVDEMVALIQREES